MKKGAIYDPATGRIISTVTGSPRTLAALSFIEGGNPAAHFVVDGELINKINSPLSDSYQYTLGGADLSLPCIPGTHVKDIDSNGETLGSYIEQDTAIEREYILAGVYHIEVTDPRFFTKTIEVVVNA